MVAILEMIYCLLCDEDLREDYKKGHLHYIHKFSVYWIENKDIKQFFGVRPKWK